MSITVKVIDRLFERMAATYGAQWSRQWDGVPIGDVKTAWAHELTGFAQRLEAIAWALENLPERCPNAIEFRNLCRNAPAPAAKPLPTPPANPERLRAELAKLGHNPKAPRDTDASVDPKGWAKRIVARHDAGEKVRRISLLFARQALGLTREAAPMREGA